MKKSIRNAKKILAFTLAVFMGVSILGLSLNADAKKKSNAGTYAEGDDIAFGTLDGNIINWTILSYDDTTKLALVISRKSLSSASVASYRKSINYQYNSTGTKAGYVKWADNYWRGWCNQIFYEECFTDEEKAMIQKTTLTAKDAQTSLMNFYHDTTLDSYYLAGNVKNSMNMSIYNNQTTTSDYVFFLSTDEYTEYRDVIKYETKYNVWPLRTNAYDDPAQGLFANDATKLIDRKYYYLGDAVRPAMYVKLGQTEEELAAAEESTEDSDTSSESTEESTSETTDTTESTTSTTTATATTATAKASSSKSYANNGTNIGNITLPDDSTYSMRNGGTAQVALNLSYLNS
nr:DUF6273 domain-containing protein [Pseudobutyrivibrio sp.]